MLIALKMMHFNKKCTVNENMKKNYQLTLFNDMTFSPNRKVASNQIRGFNKMVEHQKWNNLIEGDKNTRLDRVNQR